ncbi:MAG: hypothetical protein MUD01_16555 [Chloroflexaceae bacterium]|jgi:hypothetical protein|nr:hypothetical protein [Chloroflexaceae bacterium]
MHDAAFFIDVAYQHGATAHAAQAALNHVAQQLQVRRLQRGGLRQATFTISSFYVFRTGSGVGQAAGGGSGRTRLLLAFPSADAALSFAQRQQLGPSPRLLHTSLPRLLAVMLQRANIAALIVADETDEVPDTAALPPGFRVERAALLTMLKE